jgi:predicted small lipoprotein YifL
MLPSIQELSSVTRTPGRLFIRVATIGSLAVALGLAGCGRKGPLDPPPSGAVAEPVQAVPTGPGPSMNPISGPAKSNAPNAFGPNGEPVAAKGQKKSLFLDWLLD